MPDLVSAGYPFINSEVAKGGATLLRQNIAREDIRTDCAALTTQVMLSVPINLDDGMVISNLSFMSGATAAGTPTDWWFALYSNASTPALLAQSADQGTGVWAAKTVKKLALATPQLITVSGIYWASIMVKATTPPSLYGITVVDATVAAALVTGQCVMAQTSGSSLTTTAPSTIATPSTVATIPWVGLS